MENAAHCRTTPDGKDRTLTIDKVSAVLLADGWHELKDNSFEIDAYEFLDSNNLILGGGTAEGVTSTGAGWTEVNGQEVYCPLTSILAVKYRGASAKASP